MAWNRGPKIERMKQMLRYIFIKEQYRCYFCNEPLSWETFYPRSAGKQLDDITVHHLDHNHGNDVPENLVLGHRGCHRRYHRNYEIALKRVDAVIESSKVNPHLMEFVEVEEVYNETLGGALI